MSYAETPGRLEGFHRHQKGDCEAAHLGVGLGLVSADEEADFGVFEAARALQRLRHCRKVLHLRQLVAVNGTRVPIALQPPACILSFRFGFSRYVR